MIIRPNSLKLTTTRCHYGVPVPESYSSARDQYLRLAVFKSSSSRTRVGDRRLTWKHSAVWNCGLGMIEVRQICSIALYFCTPYTFECYSKCLT